VLLVGGVRTLEVGRSAGSLSTAHHEKLCKLA
jgi:hypothetical protein